MDDFGWTIIAALVMAVGLAGVVVPVLPGILLLWVTALVYGFAVGFGPMGIIVMIVMTLGLALSFASSVIVPKQAADQYGASTLSQWVGLLGAIIGFFVIPVVGLPIGGLVGVLGAEYYQLGDFNAAWRATKGVARGFGKSALIDLAIGLVLVLAWAGWALTVIT